MQVSTDVLRQGFFTYNNREYQAFLLRIRINPFPNTAYFRMIKFHSAVEKWRSTPWYLKWAVISPTNAMLNF